MIAPPKTQSGVRQRRATSNSLVADPDLLLQLYELLQGDRGTVVVYSNALQDKLYFVNPAVVDVETLPKGTPVYTTRELAFVITLSDEELRRYHYLKMKLIV